MKFCIRKAVVLGAGVMGAAIAGHLAGNGVQVVLLDMPVGEGQRNKLAEEAKKRLANPKTRSLYARSAADLIHTGNFEDDIDQVADADWVIEAILEKLEPKVDLFKRVSALTKEGCILSSNTSGISVNAIAKGVSAAQRPYFLGTHFFNPPRYMQLLELIPIEETSPEVLAYIETFAEERLGKSVVVAKDSPNFIANRIGVGSSSFVMHGMERFDISVAAADFLTGKLVGRPSGSLRTSDLVGFDIVKATNNTNYNAEKDPAEKDMMRLPPYFLSMMEKGMMGDKSGGGFFKREGKNRLIWDRHKEEYVSGAYTPPDGVNVKAPIHERVWAMLDSGTSEGAFLWFALSGLFVYAANRIPEITEDFRQIDRAMQLGYNWSLGPFQLWEALGTEDVNRRLAESGVQLPGWVEKHLAENGGVFYSPAEIASMATAYLTIQGDSAPTVWESEDVALKDMGDGIGAIVLSTKNASISNRAAQGIIQAVKQAEQRFRGAVLTSTGKHFCVGAELGDVLSAIDEKNWERLDANVAEFQRMTLAVRYACIPVVAAPFGSTMGGGVELCLHAHKIVAHSELYIGLVEPQVGLIPAGGGLKELAIRVMEPARYSPQLFTLSLLHQFADMVSTCQVSSSALNAVEMGILRPTDRIVAKQERLLSAAKEEAISLSQSFVPRLPQSTAVFGSTGHAAIMAQVNDRVAGRFASAYDAVIAEKVAYTLCGGPVPLGTVCTEDTLLRLEREGFVQLCQQPQTRERIEALLSTGKPLRN